MNTFHSQQGEKRFERTCFKDLWNEVLLLLTLPTFRFLGTFSNLQKATIGFACPFVFSPHGTPQVPLDRFS